MSDRNRTIQGTNTALETGGSLDDLSASKNLHEKERNRSFRESRNDADLASASISTSDIMRASHRPGTRRDIAARTSTDTARDATRTTARQHHKDTSLSKREHGVITNPAFKYDGGLVSKLVSFFANILKVLERLLLRLLMGPDVVAPTTRPQSTTPREPEQGTKLSEEEKRQRREREHGQQIVRS